MQRTQHNAAAGPSRQQHPTERVHAQEPQHDRSYIAEFLARHSKLNSGEAIGPAQGKLAPRSRFTVSPNITDFQGRLRPGAIPPKAVKSTSHKHIVRGPVKATGNDKLVPIWQLDDAAREARRNKLRNRPDSDTAAFLELGEPNSVPVMHRISAASSSARMTAGQQKPRFRSQFKGPGSRATTATTAAGTGHGQKPPRVHLTPQLTLRREGEGVDVQARAQAGDESDASASSSSSMDVDGDHRAPTLYMAARKTVALNSPKQMAGRKMTLNKRTLCLKSQASRMPPAKPRSARKIKWPPEEEDESSEAESDSDPSEDDSDSEGDTDTSRESSNTLPTNPDGNSRAPTSGPASDRSNASQQDNASDWDDMYSDKPPVKVEPEVVGLPWYGPAELIHLDSPPEITIDLPQLAPEPEPGCPAPLVAALAQIALPSIRQHETRCLPFLLRNLRRGFVARCEDLNLDTRAREEKDLRIQVKFQHTNNMQYEVTLRDWGCPVCTLMGKLPNQLLLSKHLTWDHPELYVEWKQWSDHTWTIEILVPEIPSLSQPAQAAGGINTTSTVAARDGVLTTRDLASLSKSIALLPPATPIPDVPASVSPSVERSASPSTSPSLFTQTESIIDAQDTTEYKPFAGKNRQFLSPMTATTTTPSFRSQSTMATSTTGGSTTTAVTPTRMRTPPTQFTGPDGRVYPAPPPQDNPLGPAAQRPYLPADPDYQDGVRIEYSCRPCGETLYDLLGTLSMKKFGVLAWSVLDREEEIFESDEVKDEYKVMHALWARWIMLNRTAFIANYAKGVKSFVDEYWRIIHRAAGWDALRYWLLTLFSNRFLTIKQVATTLKYYESHTGMEYWYED